MRERKRKKRDAEGKEEASERRAYERKRRRQNAEGEEEACERRKSERVKRGNGKLKDAQ